MRKPEWFETWFDTPYYHMLYQNRDVKEAEEAVPVELGGDGDSGEPTSDDLQDHAPAAGIQIGENCGHRGRDSIQPGSKTAEASRGVTGP